MTQTRTSVALVGLRGFGTSYLTRLQRLENAGEVRFAGGCDVVANAGTDLPENVSFSTDHREMINRLRPDVVVVATPPHTHFPIAVDALEAGSDVLLEKPPVVSMSQHVELLDLCRRRGRICQVGFQSLASPATQRLLEVIADGGLGEVTSISVTAHWIRLDDYYRRARWAGHRQLDGMVIADGATTNPLAHPVMNALAAAQASDPGSEPVQLDVEAYRCRDIATDDTVSARVHMSGGKRIHIAVTLCAETLAAPRVTVVGTRATAELGDTGTTLLIDGVRQDVPEERGRPLENLLAHRRDPSGVPLQAPLAATTAFTAYLEGMLGSGEPHRIDEEHLDDRPEGGSRRVILRGIGSLIDASGRDGRLFSEIGAPWAVPPVSVSLSRASATGTPPAST